MRYRRQVSRSIQASAPSSGPFMADWRRSIRLFRAFLQEQSSPDLFYSELAEDSAAQVSSWHDLTGALLLDVGGGPGYFSDAFEARGARYVAIDADAGEMRLHGRTPGPRTVLARGDAMPFPRDCFDVTYSSNVVEHLAEPWRMADDMVRVTKPGGLIFISYTLWWGPWGGHETAPWHYFGGERARRRDMRAHGKHPKNVYGESLFRTSVSRGEKWVRARSDVSMLSIRPRYLPTALRWVTRVPALREVATWNVLLVLRKKCA